jgi:hypothetical protein
VQATETSLAIIEGAIKPATPVGVAGALRGATHARGPRLELDVYGRVFNPLGYGIAVERAAARTRHRSARSSSGRSGSSASTRAAAYRIWRSIQERGTKPHAFFAPGLASVLGASPTATQSCLTASSRG